jgi:pimeloyl-ACP methyl ester carboxylesterase
MYALEEKKNLASSSSTPVDMPLASGGDQTMWLIDEDGNRVSPFASPNFRMDFVPTRRGTKCALMWIRFPRARYTILFAHGNATDLGAMRDHLIDMAMNCDVNVAAYDYSGYGLSTGKPSVANLYADADAVLAHVRDHYKVRLENLIVYGQSLGSCATSYLAEKHANLCGVVLHAGLMSAMRVLRHSTSTSWYDVFPNVDRLKKARAPVFVIHGLNDQEIPIHHGRALHTSAPNKFTPWFPEGVGHNDIEINLRAEYFEKLNEFITHLDRARREREQAAAAGGASASGEASASGDGRRV